MNRVAERFFEEEKIEYYSAVRYSACKQIYPHQIMRRGIEPKSVIIFLLPYYTKDAKNLSLYSVSRDYHIAVKEITERLIGALKNEYPQNSFFGFGDISPIDERHAAAIAGLGVIGDNRMLINEKYGSYVFIAEVICDVDPEEIGASEPTEVGHCEGCGACLNACPTKNLCSDGECLSAITQRKGELSEEEISLMKQTGTVWGCDVCQAVCPHNKNPRQTPIGFFHKGGIDLLTSELVDSMDDASFSERAFSWRGRKTVKRNLDALKY